MKRVQVVVKDCVRRLSRQPGCPFFGVLPHVHDLLSGFLFILRDRFRDSAKLEGNGEGSQWRVGKEGDGGGGRAWAMAMMALEDLYVCLRTVEPSGGGVRGVERGEGGVRGGAVH